MEVPRFLALGLRPPDKTALQPREAVQALQSASLAMPDRGPDAFVQLVDAEAVAGPRHLSLAVLRAERARHQGRVRLKDPGAVFLLYLSGTDQFAEALERAGVSAATREGVLVVVPEADPRPWVEALGWQPSPEVYPRPARPGTLLRLGARPEEVRGLPAERLELLAMEQTALSDLPRG